MWMHLHSFSDPSILPGTSKTTMEGDTFDLFLILDKAFSLSALNKLYCFHNSILSSWLANELGMYYVIFIIALVYNIHVSLLSNSNGMSIHV